MAIALCLALIGRVVAQNSSPVENHAGYIPAISGGAGYIHNVDGGITTLEPQINPVLLVPFGSHVLLESRGTFFGFYQRENQTSGPFKGQVFKSVDYAQLNWLANTHVIASAGRYLLPFGLYSERLEPIWIKNLQDAPITAAIGTRTSGSGNGFMLRGTVVQKPSYSVQYTAYFSALSNIDHLQSARVAGGDASVYLSHARLEIGTSYQRFLQDRHINSGAVYVSWQPPSVPLDIKAEADFSYNGRGYWLESAYLFQQLPVPSFFRRTQIVGRMQQFFPSNGGGNSLPRVDTQRFDAGLNYYVRDDLRFISSYGRSFSSQGNANIWNVGFTYRFLFPLWPGRSK
ncbi:MAG TPA: hypothetical protein VIX90_07605 [Edaphobacter sp.]